MVEKHLFDGAIVGAKDVANGASADEMADLFGNIFGVIASAFEFLGHEKDVETVELSVMRSGLKVSEHDYIAKAIHLSVGTEDVYGSVEIAQAEGILNVRDHLFEARRHSGEIGAVDDVDLRRDGFGAIGDIEEEVADTFERDDELHAGEEFTSFVFADAGDGGSNEIVDIAIERI
jgi:hypothetical protein